MTVIDDIKARLDIVAYIGGSVALKKAGRTYKACCPFHQEKTPSFTVDPIRQTWRCFGACADGGDVLKFAMRKNGWTFQEALQELARVTGVTLREQSPEQKQQDDRLDHLRGVIRTAADLFHGWLIDPDSGNAEWRQNAADALEYTLGKRGLTLETLARFQIGYAPPGWNVLGDRLRQLGYSDADLIDSGISSSNDNGRVYDRFRGRLIIPIRDERGRIVGFGARALSADDNPKYLNSPQGQLFDKSHILYGLDTAKAGIRETETVVIVEGYLDVIQAQQAGYHNVVAQMGTALTDAQLKLVAPRYARRVILALDSDAAGRSATMRSLEVARRALAQDFAGRMQIDIRVLNVPSGKDPDDFIRESAEQWPQVVLTAQPVADFVIDFETADMPADASIMAREEIARRLLPLLAASEHELYRAENIQKLAVRLRVNERTLLSWAAQETLSQPQPPQPRPDVQATKPPAKPSSPSVEPVWDDMPPDFDDYGMPVFDDEPVRQTPAQATVLPEGNQISTEQRSVQGERATEAYCLGRLLERPDRVHQVNRKLRELAKGDSRLIDGPLADLHHEDFSDSMHQAIWDALHHSLHQVEYDPREFVIQQLDPLAQMVFNQVTQTEERWLIDMLHKRFEPDAYSALQNFRRSYLTAQTDDTVTVALRLRASRLQRDREALQSLIVEAQESGDSGHALLLTAQVALVSRARHWIDSYLSPNADRKQHK
jgi:DNA primase